MTRKKPVMMICGSFNKIPIMIVSQGKRKSEGLKWVSWFSECMQFLLYMQNKLPLSSINFSPKTIASLVKAWKNKNGTWQFFVTFFGMVKTCPFQRLRDFHVGDRKVTTWITWNFSLCQKISTQKVWVFKGLKFHTKLQDSGSLIFLLRHFSSSSISWQPNETPPKK